MHRVAQLAETKLREEMHVLVMNTSVILRSEHLRCWGIVREWASQRDRVTVPSGGMEDIGGSTTPRRSWQSPRRVGVGLGAPARFPESDNDSCLCHKGLSEITLESIRAPFPILITALPFPNFDHLLCYKARKGYGKEV